MKTTELYKTLGFSDKFVELIESKSDISDPIDNPNNVVSANPDSNYWDIDNVIIENSQESQNMIYNS